VRAKKLSARAAETRGKNLLYDQNSVICIGTELAHEINGAYGAGCPMKRSPATRLRSSRRFRSTKSGARVGGWTGRGQHLCGCGCCVCHLHIIPVPISLAYQKAKITTLERSARGVRQRALDVSDKPPKTTMRVLVTTKEQPKWASKRPDLAC
jgi:hypothetical protein